MAKNTSDWGRATARERYAPTHKADGGLVKQLRDDQGDAAENIKSQMKAGDLSESMKGKFWDTGRTIPGREAAHNLKWERDRGLKSRIVKEASGGRLDKPARKAAGGEVAKKGGSPTSSKTATKTSTKTSTVANPKGNVTVTGGAGDGDTHVTIEKPARKAGGGAIDNMAAPSDSEAFVDQMGRYDPKSPGFKERNEKAAQDARERAKSRPSLESEEDQRQFRDHIPMGESAAPRKRGGKVK